MAFGRSKKEASGIPGEGTNVTRPALEEGQRSGNSKKVFHAKSLLWPDLSVEVKKSQESAYQIGDFAH